MMQSPRSALWADLALLAVAIAWGTSFPIMRVAIPLCGPLTFIGIRYTLAGLFFVVFFFGRFRGALRRALYPGLLLGFFLAAGTIFQAVGIQYTTAGKTGFITGLYIVFVPFLAGYMLRQPLRLVHFVSVGLAVVGMGLLSLGSEWTFNKGDLWVLACAVSFAIHLVGVSRFAPEVDAIVLTTVQIFVVGLGSLFLAPFSEALKVPDDPRAWAAIVYLAVFATSIAIWIWMTMQPKTSPVRASLILSLESVFAAIFAWWWIGERLTTRELTGCALVALAVVICEWKPKKVNF